MKLSLIFFIIIQLISSIAFSQNDKDNETEERITDELRPSARNISWIITQLIPSPTWLNDRNDNNSSLNFAFRWQVTALNISFSTNKFVSPVQTLFVNPMRKYTGSLELFVQPELAITSLDYSGFNKAALGLGSRLNIPVKNYGEHMYISLGGKYTFRNNPSQNISGYYGLEAGVYFLFGSLGLQGNYNFNKNTEYNFSIYFKYW
ncbi:MAG: hypothetical protein KBF96_04315 [Ignavibacteria bacterium]|nr:hypothetical protein [Ignavibacteria bacterium]